MQPKIQTGGGRWIAQMLFLRIPTHTGHLRFSKVSQTFGTLLFECYTVHTVCAFR